MTKKLTLITFVLSLCSGIVFSEDIQEIVILEKKLSSLNGWSNNQSVILTDGIPFDMVHTVLVFSL